jgi:fatty acid desaturase
MVQGATTLGAKGVDARFYEIRPARLALDAARSYALIAAGIAAALASPWALLPSVLLIGSQQYALQILLHDGMHGRLLRRKRDSDRLARLLLCYPILEPLAGFRRKHLDHHRHLGEGADPDRYYHATDDKATRLRFLLFLSGLSSAWATWRQRQQRVEGRPGRPQAEAEAAESRFDLRALAATQLGIAALLTGLGGWWAYPVLWLLPWGLGVYLAQNLRSFAEHAQPEPDRQADRHRHVTFTASRLERFFIAPNNMNHHAEHHMYPQVPYYHLPALRAQLEAEGRMAQVEYRASYLGFALRFWRALPIES